MHKARSADMAGTPVLFKSRGYAVVSKPDIIARFTFHAPASGFLVVRSDMLRGCALVEDVRRRTRECARRSRAGDWIH